MCQHGWRLREGQECPECLWDEAGKSHAMSPQKRARIVALMVEATIAAVIDHAHKRRVRQCQIECNNYAAIKMARSINLIQKEGK